MNNLQILTVRPPRSVHWRLPAYSVLPSESCDRRTKKIDSAQTHDLASEQEQELVSHARNRLNDHTHFRGRMGSISIKSRGDRLVVTGKLPSFYLKQLLQSALMQVDGVCDVENHVAVVSSEGLSSPTKCK